MLGGYSLKLTYHNILLDSTSQNLRVNNLKVSQKNGSYFIKISEFSTDYLLAIVKILKTSPFITGMGTAY